MKAITISERQRRNMETQTAVQSISATDIEQRKKVSRILREMAFTPIERSSDPLDIAGLWKLPETAEERDRLNRELDALVLSEWRARLSDQDRELLERWQPNSDSDDVPASVQKKYDAILVELAEEIGWPIFECVRVRRRLAWWCEQAANGDETATRFMEAVLGRVRVRRGKITGKITHGDWKLMKNLGVAELRDLKRLYRLEFGKRNRWPEYVEMCKWYRKTIAESPDKFPFWLKRLAPLTIAMEQAFVWRGGGNPARVRDLLRGEYSPSSMFDFVAGTSELMTQSTARRKISEAAKLSLKTSKQ